MSFCFRLRFRMAGALNCGDLKKVFVKFSGIDQPVSIAGENEKIEGAFWLIGISCGYPSEDAARLQGERFRTAMVMAGAFNRFGADCGHDKRTLQFSKAITDEIKETHGVEMRGSLHGLDVFEKDKVAHVSMNAKGSVGKGIDDFRADIENVLTFSSDVTERQKISAALINDSFFVPNVDVQFVMRVSAIEALCDQHDLKQPHQNLISELLKRLEPIQEDWIHELGLGLVRRFNMMRIMARRTKAATVRA